jgi:hypothetical protein
MNTSTPHRFDIYSSIHKALRALMADTLFKLGRMDPDDPQDVAQTAQDVRRLLDVCRSHANHENRFIHPLLEAHAAAAGLLPGCAAGAARLRRRPRLYRSAGAVHREQLRAPAPGGDRAQRGAVGALLRRRDHEPARRPGRLHRAARSCCSSCAGWCPSLPRAGARRDDAKGSGADARARRVPGGAWTWCGPTSREGEWVQAGARAWRTRSWGSQAACTRTRPARPGPNCWRRERLFRRAARTAGAHWRLRETEATAGRCHGAGGIRGGRLAPGIPARRNSRAP